jgi:hypothetical protein
VESFRRVPRAFVARMDEVERRVLAQVVEDVESLLVDGAPTSRTGAWSLGDDASPPDDPAVARLLPDASMDDGEVAAEFRRLTQEDLRRTKVDGLRLLRERLLAQAPGYGTDDVVVREAEAARFAAALTDVRLVLADRLGLESDDDAETLHAELSDVVSRGRADRSRRGLGDLYEALTWLQESLLQVMTGLLPKDGKDVGGRRE